MMQISLFLQFFFIWIASPQALFSVRHFALSENDLKTSIEVSTPL